MRKIRNKIYLAILAIAVILGTQCDVAYAVKKESAITEEQSTSEKEEKINLPLDNAVPTIYYYSVLGDGYITPGEEFTIRFNLKNPAVVSDAANIVISVDQKENLIYPAVGNTNSVYVGYIGAYSFRDGELTLVASKNIKEEEVPIDITLSYTDNYKTINVQQLTAVLPVSTNGKLNVNTVDIPSTMYVGSNNRMSITYSNDGLSTINDVRLHLTGDSIEEREISLGSIGSSTSVTSDVYIEFLEEGIQKVDMYFTYMDRDGQTVSTDIKTYTFDVASFDAPISIVDEKYINRRNIVNHILTLCVLFLSVGVVISYYLKRKQKNNKKSKDEKILTEGDKS